METAQSLGPQSLLQSPASLQSNPFEAGKGSKQPKRILLCPLAVQFVPSLKGFKGPRIYVYVGAIRTHVAMGAVAFLAS